MRRALEEHLLTHLPVFMGRGHVGHSCCPGSSASRKWL